MTGCTRNRLPLVGPLALYLAILAAILAAIAIGGLS